MSGAPTLPPELRRAVEADLRPVRPLPSPARRALRLLAWAPLAAAVVVSIRGLRPDVAALGPLLTWGVVVAEVAAGAGLVVLALAESVPGRGAGRSTGLLALGGSSVLFAVLAVLSRRASEGVAVPDPLVSFGPTCAGIQGVVGLTALGLAAFVVIRGAPLRAAFPGLLAGAGAGFMTEGIYHLHCPITHLSHVLVWHGAAILFLSAVGLAFGLALDGRERRLMELRRAERRSGKGDAA